MMVLEELEHAQARGAHIIAEIVGYGANCDGSHITRPEMRTMQRCMELALEDAALPPSAVGYVSGHGTATEQATSPKPKPPPPCSATFPSARKKATSATPSALAAHSNHGLPSK